MRVHLILFKRRENLLVKVLRITVFSQKRVEIALEIFKYVFTKIIKRESKEKKRKNKQLVV
jgi:hypothetical protein